MGWGSAAWACRVEEPVVLTRPRYRADGRHQLVRAYSSTLRRELCYSPSALHQRARRHTQVNCSKCSEPIALSDVIESSDSRLSHVDCKRPRMLTSEERALLFVYCYGHAVAYCLGCDLRFRLTELAADALG